MELMKDSLTGFEALLDMAPGERGKASETLMIVHITRDNENLP